MVLEDFASNAILIRMAQDVDAAAGVKGYCRSPRSGDTKPSLFSPLWREGREFGWYHEALPLSSHSGRGLFVFHGL
ncbi:hypothetical protein CGZ75_08935 [Paenibacillus herberti]|uniref:Uncharacterized protein n=1 Tax=Paenibacillus herberti TaxID=1619309 RepID=A0A229P3D9_9BACL|nr:hypothetical protein CGZ75_08935 [Paenibacillus herberti]